MLAQKLKTKNMQEWLDKENVDIPIYKIKRIEINIRECFITFVGIHYYKTDDGGNFIKKDGEYKTGYLGKQVYTLPNLKGK